MTAEEAKELVNKFETSVVDWRAESGGPDRDYERWAREEKEKLKAQLIKELTK